MPSYRKISRYALGLEIGKNRGWLHLWLQGGSTDPHAPDFNLNLDAASLAVATALLKNDSDQTSYFDPSLNVLASGFEA